MLYKICRKCNISKPIVDFSYRESNRDGRDTMCRKCSAKISLIAVRRRRYLILEHYSNGIPKCACCGEEKIEFLSIDHINGGGHKHRKSIGGQKIDQWLLQQGFPDGFRILCHNCNQALGNYGYCPHIAESVYENLEIDKPALQTIKLSSADVLNIRKELEGGKLQKELANKYSVSRATICLIANRKARRNI